MKNTVFIFDAASIGCFLIGAGFNDVSNAIYEILGIISFIISIIAGSIGLIMKFKHYISDGKLTDDEINDLVNDAKDIKKQFDDLEDKKNDKQ